MAAQTPILKPAPSLTGMGEKAAPPDVMGAMRQQRGGAPARAATPVDILRSGLMQQLEDPQAVQQAVSEFAKLAQAGLTKFVQIGNTLFLVNQFDSNQKMLPQGTAEVHVFTEEPLEAMTERLAVVPNTLRQMGYNRIISYTTDPGIARILQGLQGRIGIQAVIRQAMRNLGGEMTPVFEIEVPL
jgi:hypothetical protein